MAEKLLNFVAVGRTAVLRDTKYEKKVQDVFSYYPNGYRWKFRYRQGIWDGKESMLKEHTLPIGILRADEIKTELAKLKFVPKLRKWVNRPVFSQRRGFIEAEEKYRYQNDCVREMLRAIRFGGGIVLSATGSGKTKMAAQFFSWIDTPCLFVVDQRDLLYQSAKEITYWLNKALPKKTPWKIGVVGDSKFEPEINGITVATIQTLHKHRRKAGFRKWYKQIDIVVIDELHVQMNRRNFSVLDAIRPSAVFGLTATLQLRRKDVRLRAYAICGPVVYTFPVQEGMKQKVLSKGIAVQLQVHDDNLLQRQPTQGMSMRFKMRAIEANYRDAVVENRSANSAILALVRQALMRGYYCVVLVDRLAHLHKIADALEDLSPTLCYGAVEVADRQKAVRRMDAGKANLIIANQVFKKGINIKRVDLIIDAAQRSNKNDVLQKFGRGVRLHSDKKGLLYVDIATVPHMEKQARSRFNALKAAKINVSKCNKYEDVFKIGKHLLETT